MSAVIRVVVIVSVLLVSACGGSGSGGSGGKTVSSVVSSSSISSATQSSTSQSNVSSQASLSSHSSESSHAVLSSSSNSSLAVTDDFPTGTVDTLPSLAITTDGAAPIVSKEDYVTGQFTLNGVGVAQATGSLEIRGRGNSTWGWPKKPYRLKLTNSAALLGMPASKHWVLLANYADKTLMRNDIAFMLSKNMGMEYAPRSQYVEVKLNGVYQGVYQLVEHIRVAKDRVNIPEMKVTDTDAEKISGGYLMEIDFRYHKDYCKSPDAMWEPYCVNGENLNRQVDFCLDSTHGMNPFCLQSPETLHDPAWSAQRAYIEKYFADTEAALFGSNFKDPDNGYAAYLDVDSVINYYLINELFKNPDGALASAFVYKKRNGKLFFGPVWDFDLSLGNAGYDGVDNIDGWHIRNAPWFKRLFEDPAFEAKVKARWNALKANGKFELIFTYAEARATWLEKQQAKNYSVWSITDFAGWIKHGTHGGTGSYDAEVNELIRWQRDRYQWMDTQLSK